ncbi:MAG: transketolase C-terminal domain-containing protein [Methanomassiliicoccales archaeon]
MIEVINSNYAAAFAAKLARVEVIAAYPITPQTSISEKLAEMVELGEMDAKYLKVESEHSAMAALIGSSYAGARSFTATSSQGLALMHENLVWASGVNRPIVMPVAARALSGPWSIWSDHSDVISERDVGWIQFFCENNQETLDSTIMAFKVAEDPEVMTPAMVVEDGFILSHTVEPVEIPSQEKVDDFLPPFDPEYRIEFGEAPRRYGGVVAPDWWTEFRYRNHLNMERAKEKIMEVDRQFEKAFGRSYGGLVEFYRCEDAEVVLVVAGATVGTAKDVADEMREEGHKVGVVKLRTFRPFPSEEIRRLNDMVPVVGVFDKSYTWGQGGAFFQEIRNALYDGGDQAMVKNYIGGLGGRDVSKVNLRRIFEDLLSLSKGGRVDRLMEWVALKDGTGRWE